MDPELVEACIAREFEDEKEILGRNLYSRLISDAVGGKSSDIAAPSGGHAIDISNIVEMVKLGAELFIAAYGVYEIGKKSGSTSSKEIDELKSEDRFSKLDKDRKDRLAKNAKDARERFDD